MLQYIVVCYSPLAELAHHVGQTRQPSTQNRSTATDAHCLFETLVLLPLNFSPEKNCRFLLHSCFALWASKISVSCLGTSLSSSLPNSPLSFSPLGSISFSFSFSLLFLSPSSLCLSLPSPLSSFSIYLSIYLCISLM